MFKYVHNVAHIPRLLSSSKYSSSDKGASRDMEEDWSVEVCWRRSFMFDRAVRIDVEREDSWAFFEAVDKFVLWRRERFEAQRDIRVRRIESLRDFEAEGAGGS